MWRAVSGLRLAWLVARNSHIYCDAFCRIHEQELLLCWLHSNTILQRPCRCLTPPSALYRRVVETSSVSRVSFPVLGGWKTVYKNGILLCRKLNSGGQDRSGFTVTNLRAGRSMYRGSIACSDLPLLQRVHTGSVVYPAQSSVWTGDAFLGDKATESVNVITYM